MKDDHRQQQGDQHRRGPKIHKFKHLNVYVLARQFCIRLFQIMPYGSVHATSKALLPISGQIYLVYSCIVSCCATG